MEEERISEHKSVIKVYYRLRSELVEEHEKIDRVYKRIEKEGAINKNRNIKNKDFLKHSLPT